MNAGIRSMIGSGLVALAVALALPTVQAQGTAAPTQKSAKSTAKTSPKTSKVMNTTKTKVASTKKKSSHAATVTKPAATVSKPAATVTKPAATVTKPAVTTTNPSVSTPMASPTAVAKASPKSAVGKLDASNNVRAGATAKCKDGSYSHATTHAGACSGHQGVARWY